MKKARPLGLICAGPAKNLAFARLPGVADALGPVKAPSFRLASRTTNTMRSGYPVRHYAELAECGLLLLCLPDRAVRRVLDDLLRAPIAWSGMGVVVVSAMLDSSDLQLVGEQGAGVASLFHLEGIPGQRYLAEGDHTVLRELRSLLPTESQLVVISPRTKDLCLAGLALATTALTPIIDTAVECLNGAGLQHRESTALVERLMQNTLRGFAKSGRKSWNGPLADKDWAALHKQLDALAAHDPELGRWFELGVRNAIQRMHKGAEWPAGSRRNAAC